MHSLGFAAGEHVLRWVLVLVVLGPLARMAGQRGTTRDGASTRQQWLTTLRIRFFVAGLILGGTWIWRSKAPLWEHALRLVFVMLVLAPALRWLRNRAAKQSGRPAPRSFRSRYWLLAKLALIGIGTAVQAGLEQTMSRTDAALVVGALLFAATALGGPLITVRAIRHRRERAPSDDDSADPS